jgi:branched-chain amino acid transport system permease protein
MGESVLILAFVVIIIGGIGSIRGALVGSLIVGTVDTLGRALLPTLLRATLPPMRPPPSVRHWRPSSFTC